MFIQKMKRTLYRSFFTAILMLQWGVLPLMADEQTPLIPDNAEYFIAISEISQGTSQLKASVQGRHYSIIHPSWASNGLAPVGIFEELDIDNDGYLDAVLELAHNGNCCPPSFAVISYRGEGFFSVLNDEPISAGWGGVELLKLPTETIVRTYESSDGTDNLHLDMSYSDYVVRGGKVLKAAEYSNHAMLDVAQQITAEQVKDDNAKGILKIDLDFDGEEDIVTCSYWDRWGSLKCTAKLSTGRKVELPSCKRLGFLPSNDLGYMEVVCNRRYLATLVQRD